MHFLEQLHPECGSTNVRKFPVLVVQSSVSELKYPCGDRCRQQLFHM